MAVEMQRARLDSLRLHLVLDLEMVTPTYAMIVVQNIGPGAALQCELELTLRGAAATERRDWQPQLLPAGDRHEFIPPDGVNSLDGLAAAYPTITLTGGARDTIGRTHSVDEMMDVTAMQAGLREALHRFERPADERLVKEAEKIVKQLDAIDKALRKPAT